MARIGEKIAFVFTGGGSLGAIQVGMLRVLLAAGVQPDFVVGASVGAINASYFASAPTAEGVEKLERIWTGLRRSDIFPFTLASAIGLFRNPGNLVDPSRLRRIIEMHLPFVRLEETQIPLHIMATTLQGLGVRLSSGAAVEAILASTAIPGIFPHVEINGIARRCCGSQHADAACGGTRRVADHHSSDWLCMCLEGTTEKCRRESIACDHPDDRLAAYARTGAYP